MAGKDCGPILRRGLVEHLPALKGAPLSVFVYLALEADHKSFRITKSADQIATATGYSLRAVKDALRFLTETPAGKEHGYITKEDPTNPWQASTYFIPKLSLGGAKIIPLDKPRSSADIAPLPVVQKVAHGGAVSGAVSGANIAPPNIDNKHKGTKEQTSKEGGVVSYDRTTAVKAWQQYRVKTLGKSLAESPHEYDWINDTEKWITATTSDDPITNATPYDLIVMGVDFISSWKVPPNNPVAAVRSHIADLIKEGKHGD